MLSLGFDIGSVAVKVAVLQGHSIVQTIYRRFTAGPFETLLDILSHELSFLSGRAVWLGTTGIGGKTTQSILGGGGFGEIAALAEANFLLLPSVRTVIEMGGEDSKLLILDAPRRSIVDFAMNAQCAAGTGSFLDQQAARLNISIENEFGQLALKSARPPRIAGRCSVFAKSDMIHLQQIATPDYDIVAGLCFAVARNFKSSIARGKRFDLPIAFEGGVAANPGMVRAFTEILKLGEDELIIPNQYNTMGAIGAALLAQARQAGVEQIQLQQLEMYIEKRQTARGSRRRLTYVYPESKHYDVTLSERPPVPEGYRVYLGIDVGSLSTNLVLVDDNCEVIARRYLMTEGRPIEAVRRGLAEIGKEAGERVVVAAVGTTGSGRYLTGDFVGADIVRNEITAQATAAIQIDPDVDTIFEIGGQDSKYISIEKRTVVDFEMNKACAAGTGSFLQEQAEKLRINIKSEFGDRALRAECPVGCGERCTVFMESDLVAHQRSGVPTDDLVAGLAYSIASNYLNKVVGDRRIGQNIFFQGGVAWNQGVVAAFEQLTGCKVTVPPHHDVTGAIGAAILAKEASADKEFRTRFKGFDLYKRRYQVSGFTCGDCSNQCEIHKVELEGESPLYYGARCEKYEVDHAASGPLPKDYFAKRRHLLGKKQVRSDRKVASRGRIGLPRVLHFFDFLPFWTAFFESLGFTVVSSEASDQQIVEQSLELFPAETCFPIKLVYGHISDLLKKKVDIVFLPAIIRVAGGDEPLGEAGYICPYVQTIGSAVRTRFDFAAAGVRLLTPAVSLAPDTNNLTRQLKPLQSALHVSDRNLERAAQNALKAYHQYRTGLVEAGQDLLAHLKPDDRILVVISRPYNGNDQRLSLELPDKIRKLGLTVVPMDMLPLDEADTNAELMYWRYGRLILTAARFIRNHPNLYAIYLSSFGCGPDSFITHYFRRLMAGKPYLQLEIDEHSADAGLITRVEAFVDSLRFYRYRPSVDSFTIASDCFRPFERTIYIPNMCDHAYGLRAAMERYGLKAEVLDEPDEVSLEVGKKFTSGKECFPCQITTGDIVSKVRAPDFDRSRAVFFMPGANGPCRFGQYRQFHRLVLDDLGFREVPILSPNSKDGYTEFGLDGTTFRSTAWKALVFVDCLLKLKHQVQPYEINRGETERLYYHYLKQMEEVIVRDKSLIDLAAEASEAFTGIATSGRPFPLVGLVGEIFLRTNRFSNNHLIDKLQALGLEVWLAPFTEWPLYTSQMYRFDSWRQHNLNGLIASFAQLAGQRWQERKLFKAFARSFPIRHDDTVAQVLRYARKYLPYDCKGEAILSVGKSIEMVRAGASGIVNAMPFNCMPGTIVSSLSRRVAEDMGGAPWLNISYEGLRDSGEDTRLEAFAEQVKSFCSNKHEPLISSPAETSL